MPARGGDVTEVGRPTMRVPYVAAQNYQLPGRAARMSGKR
jgi:hypothetical protein